jgi:hypothetical protein
MLFGSRVKGRYRGFRARSRSPGFFAEKAPQFSRYGRDAYSFSPGRKQNGFVMQEGGESFFRLFVFPRRSGIIAAASFFSGHLSGFCRSGPACGPCNGGPRILKAGCFLKGRKTCLMPNDSAGSRSSGHRPAAAALKREFPMKNPPK